MARSDLYTLTTAGDLPVTLAELKQYLKIDTSADDDLLNLLLTAATQFGEKYTRRDFRANTWTLLIDAFATRICLRRSDVASITSVEYTVTTTHDTTIASSVYYLKQLHSASEILLQDGEAWPSDLATVEHGIQIIFVTQDPECLEELKVAILRHVAYVYVNRGDCGVDMESVKASGAKAVYDQVRIARV